MRKYAVPRTNPSYTVPRTNPYTVPRTNPVSRVHLKPGETILFDEDSEISAAEKAISTFLDLFG